MLDKVVPISWQVAIVLAMLMMVAVPHSEAFAPLLPSKKAAALKAWSLQIPDNLSSFKSTWYNEVDNPTARRLIYDE